MWARHSSRGRTSQRRTEGRHTNHRRNPIGGLPPNLARPDLGHRGRHRRVRLLRVA